MNEPEKPLTLAEKQIKRLEALRGQNQPAPTDPQIKISFPEKTYPVQKIEDSSALKGPSRQVPVFPHQHPFEGKTKSVRLTFHQLKILEKLLSHNKQLRRSPLMRLAINRLLNLPITAEEKELEKLLHETLHSFKSRP